MHRLLLTLSAALLLSACAEGGNPFSDGKDGLQDALDLREHEKLKDAAEDARDAMENAAEGLKQAVEEATGDD